MPPLRSPPKRGRSHAVEQPPAATDSLADESPRGHAAHGKDSAPADPGKEHAKGTGQHHLVNAGQPTLRLLDDLRLERTLTVSWHVDGDRPGLGQHRL